MKICVNKQKRDGVKRGEKAIRHVMMIIGLCLRIDHSIHIDQGTVEDVKVLDCFESCCFIHLCRRLIDLSTFYTWVEFSLHKKQQTFIKWQTCNHGDMQSYTTLYMFLCNVFIRISQGSPLSQILIFHIHTSFNNYLSLLTIYWSFITDESYIR